MDKQERSSAGSHNVKPGGPLHEGSSKLCLEKPTIEGGNGATEGTFLKRVGTKLASMDVKFLSVLREWWPLSSSVATKPDNTGALHSDETTDDLSGPNVPCPYLLPKRSDGTYEYVETSAGLQRKVYCNPYFSPSLLDGHGQCRLCNTQCRTAIKEMRELNMMAPITL